MASNLAITFSEPSSDPTGVLHFHYDGPGVEEQHLKPGHILVSFVVSPINPQDSLVIAGRYPVKPLNKHNGEPIPGYDGVARVIAVGPPCSSSESPEDLRPGDLVIPRRHGLGTWRSRAIFAVDDVMRIKRTTDPIAASLFRMAFLPAYLLVEDMRRLKPGDWIVQNAGSGTIAQLVAQFARLKGCHVCSVVRDRGESDLQALRERLQPEQGGVPRCIFVTEGEIRDKGVNAHPALAEAAARGRVVLALDSVFGESGQRLAGLLSRNSTFVNYGSLGGADGIIQLTQRILFWNQVQFRNFRLSEQLALRPQEEQESLIKWFESLLQQRALVCPEVGKLKVPQQSSGEAVSEFEANMIQLLRQGNRDKTGTQVGVRKHVLDFWKSSSG